MTQITKEAIEAGLRITLSSVNMPAGECLHETDVREILEAALPFLPIAGEGKVKALEWIVMREGDEIAETILGTYTITGGSIYLVWFAGQADHEDYAVAAPSMDAAKSFAQTDYETRILSALISSPGKDGGREVEAVKTVWQVADAIDPERSPDGGWRDQLLNEIHADLENRGRRDKDFAVTVHHRNIVISAVSKALRGLPSVSKEAAPMKDHARGCEGRNYTCTCGHDAKRDDLIDRLTKALEPFAKEAGCYDPDTGDGDDTVWATPVYFKIRDLREARNALSSSQSTSTEGER